MDVVFQGRLSEEQDISEVLTDILALKDGEHGVLRISSPAEDLNGRLFLRARRFIVAADIIDSGESGYGAMRKLLSVKEGNFAYLDADAADMDSPVSMHLDIETVLQQLPDLPEALPGLPDGSSQSHQATAASADVKDAIDLVRAATVAGPPAGADESIGRLRGLQSRSRLWRTLALWAAFLAAAFVAANAFGPSLVQQIESQALLRDLDREGLKLIDDLRRRIRGEEETAQPMR